jgi:hypothetical protein
MSTSSQKLLKIFIVVIIFSSCNSSSSKKSSTVTTNFAVTGSGQDALVYNNFQSAFSMFFPSAMAFSPAMIEDANGSQVDLTEAWIVLKKIQFNSSQTANESDTAHYQGPFFIDLLRDAPAPFGEITLPAVGLRRVKMLLHKDNHVPEHAPTELSGKSIYLKGTINSHEFTYAADDTTDFEISGPHAVVPEEGKDLLAVIRLADLMKKIDLSGITSDTAITSSSRFPAVNPCPEIHATAFDLYTCFKKGIALEAKFGKDNGDLDLDSEDEVVNE